MKRVLGRHRGPSFMIEEINVQRDATAGPSSHSWTQGCVDRIQTQVRVQNLMFNPLEKFLYRECSRLRAREDETMWNFEESSVVLDGWRLPDALWEWWWGVGVTRLWQRLG